MKRHRTTYYAGYHEDSVGGYGDAVILAEREDEWPSHIKHFPFSERGERLLAQLHNARIEGGYRSCVKTQDDVDYRWWADFRDLLLTSMDPNPDDDRGFGQNGTQWGMHVFGLAGGRISGVEFEGIIGAGGAIEATNEGHALYNTLSIEEGDRLVYENCHMHNCGGHGLYHVSSWGHPMAINPARAGGAPLTELGARVVVRKCHIQDVDLSTRRGSFAVYLPDVIADHVFDQVVVISDLTGQYKDADGGWVDSRGLLGAFGVMGRLVDRGGLWRAAEDCDRPEQFMIRGPRAFIARGSRFEFSQLHINTKGKSFVPGQPETELVRLQGVTGTAKIFFNGEEVGQLDDRPQNFEFDHESEFWTHVRESKQGINFGTDVEEA